jgi:hypothetical protein
MAGLTVYIGGEGYTQTALADAPGGLWRMDAASGTSETDRSVNGNTGTYHGGVTFNQSGALGDGIMAALFNGTSGYLTTPAQVTASMTAEAWVYPTATGFFLRIFSSGIAAFSSSNFPFELAITSGGTLAFFLNFTTLAPGWIDTAATLPLNTWSYVAMTWDGTTLRVYKNGSQVYSNAAWAGRVLQTGSVMIGATVGPGSFWPGKIGYAAVYSSALSAARIATRYTYAEAQVNKTSICLAGSFAADDTLNARATCAFTLLDPAGTYRPVVGQSVKILNQDGVTREFFGSIDSFDEWQQGVTDLYYNVRCVDLNQVADRHLVARQYTSMTAGAIVADIIANDLLGETAIVSTSGIEAGVTISSIVFNYCSAAAAFNELAQYCGFSWWIDYNGAFNFKSRASVSAPFGVLSTDTPCKARKGLRISRTREQYRNKQYLRAGTDLTSSRTESFKGDGTLRTFVLQFPAGTAPSVTVNGVAKTIGIRGVDTDSSYDFFWNKGQNEITQSSAGVVLSTIQTLAVTYCGLYPIVSVVQNDAEITSRALIEGGSGLYEANEDDPNINNTTTAGDKATAIIRRYGSIPVTVDFETDTTGLASGQLITISLPAHGLNGQYLIESVRSSDVADATGGFVRYSVRALDGSTLGGWQAFFRRLMSGGQEYVIRENEVLLLIRNVSELIVSVETLTVASGGPESRVGFALVGFSQVN